MRIAFSGPRELTKEQEKEIYNDFCYFITTEKADWYVGDASGLDNFVRRAHSYFTANSNDGYKVGNLNVFKVEGNQPYHFAIRSKKMIDAIAKQPDSWLYAFPNKPCPDGCFPSSNPSGKGSGTWLTIAYAKYHKIPIHLFPLSKFKNPSWLTKDDNKDIQLTLF